MRILAILIFALIFNQTASADIDLYPIKVEHFTKFESLSIKDGLAGNNVLDIIQDTIGFMWFATDNGLSRYDGYGFVTYRNIKDDSSSISNNLVTSLEIDNLGNLWAGTENGLNLFNRATETFTSFYKGDGKFSLNDNHVKALFADKQDNLWIETAGGVLHKLVISTLELTKYKHEKPHQPYYRYHSIYEDSESNLWIGGRGIPIMVFNRAKEEFIYYLADPNNPNKKRDNDIACYFEDSNHNFYVSATDGIYLMDRETLSFKKIFKSSTFSIIEDRNGTVWAGSARGLIKNDKNSFINYRKNQDNPFSIIDNHIHKLYEDRSGIIWIGTQNGISKYIPNKYKFENYRHISNQTNTLSGNNISSILQDKNGNVWIGTKSNGLNKLDIQTNEIIHFKFDENIKQGLSSNRVSSLYIDEQNNIWVGLWAGVGFNKLNPETHKFIHYAYDPKTTNHDWYNDFIEIRNAQFFCGIWGANGFAEFDRNKERFTGLSFLNGSRPQNRNIKSIHYTNGRIYFGSETYKLYAYDIYSQHFTSYYKTVKETGGSKLKVPFGDQKNIIDLAFKDINAMVSYNDKLLFCASDKGVLIQNLREDSFQTITKQKNPNLLEDNITSLFKLSPDTLCILSNAGINFYELQNRQLLPYSIALTEAPITVLKTAENLILIYHDFIQKRNLKRKEVLNNYYLKDPYSEVKISSAIEFTNNKIILGTNRGACIFDIEKGTIMNFFDDSFNKTQHWCFVNTLFKDGDKNIWLGSDIGFGKLDLTNSTVEWVKDSTGDIDRIINRNVQCFTEDDAGNLWLGTETGACIYDKKNNQITHLRYKGAYGLSSALVNKLFEDTEGNIWIGTSDQGLNIILPNGDLKNYFGDPHDPTGLRSEDVKSIFQDSKGNVWVGGNSGLNKFEGLDKKVKHFSVADGLPHQSIKAMLEDENNHLWISTSNGISQFNLTTEKVIRNYDMLDGLQDNNFNSANCKLENSLLMFGGDNGITVIDPANISTNDLIPKIAFTSFSKQNDLITTELSSGDTIIILPSTKFFSVEFSALDFTEPLKNAYRYRLTGSFDEWIDLGSEHRISFTNISSGRYELHISASNNEGIWNEEGIYLVLIIKPPFWKTWWFISLNALVVLLVVSTILALKISSLEKEKKNLQLEQRLLRTQMNPHFIFNSLAALQGLIYKKETKTVISYLSKFASLMRSILYHSREESIMLNDEISFIENYLKLQQLRFSDRFEYQISIDDKINPSNVSVPPMLLQPFIENSIAHGFKEKSDNKGQILIHFKKAKNMLTISIEDNGIGIEKAKKLKLTNNNKHKSLGIYTTIERIRKLNNSKMRDKVFEIVDLGEMGLKNSGTKVSFCIPFIESF